MSACDKRSSKQRKRTAIGRCLLCDTTDGRIMDGRTDGRCWRCFCCANESISTHACSSIFRRVSNDRYYPLNACNLSTALPCLVVACMRSRGIRTAATRTMSLSASLYSCSRQLLAVNVPEDTREHRFPSWRPIYGSTRFLFRIPCESNAPPPDTA